MLEVAVECMTIALFTYNHRVFLAKQLGHIVIKVRTHNNQVGVNVQYVLH